MEAVPPDPPHLRIICEDDSKGKNPCWKASTLGQVPGSLACTWSWRSLLGTWDQGVRFTKNYYLNKIFLTQSRSACSWPTQSQGPRTQETCTRQGCSPCRSHRTWSSQEWGTGWQRSCRESQECKCKSRLNTKQKWLNDVEQLWSWNMTIDYN